MTFIVHYAKDLFYNYRTDDSCLVWYYPSLKCATMGHLLLTCLVLRAIPSYI